MRDDDEGRWEEYEGLTEGQLADREAGFDAEGNWTAPGDDGGWDDEIEPPLPRPNKPKWPNGIPLWSGDAAKYQLGEQRCPHCGNGERATIAIRFVHRDTPQSRPPFPLPELHCWRCLWSWAIDLSPAPDGPMPEDWV